MPTLTAVLVPAPDRIVVRFTGETDLSTAPAFAAELARAAAHGTRWVLVDVSRLRFWDCSGLHSLAYVTAELAQAGRQVRIIGAGAATRRLIAMADFSEALELDGPVQLLRRPHRQPGAPSTHRHLEGSMEIPA
ncbi:MAG: STAS domain-containing protein [Actinomycetes bacterium]